MRRIFYILAAMASLGTMGCEVLKNLDTTALTNAATTALTAMTLTDAQVQELGRQTIAALDAENKIAPTTNPQAQRLARITKNWTSVGDLPLNFKVYETTDINAFACPDGSIRVYSGLMENMTDEELVAVLGHEIGHIVNTDSKDALKNSYYSIAGQQAISSLGGSIGNLPNTIVGKLGAKYLDAQYSQKQEYAADDFGFDFAVAMGYSPMAMANSLNKLVQLSGQAGTAPKLTQMFSTHPDTQGRAVRMKTKAEGYNKK